MKTNIYVTTEVYNHAEQKLLIQPTPEFGGFSDAIISFDPPTIFLDINDKLLIKTK